ncbi:TrbG/VirB9 family P-type conjugative transfer protein [Hydrogenophaga sp.]|uniref:TrbG/VirB9 family P-type conjugative transfer protein n=1 Tax=Hydrogenophaga sp. TaxID=1904254 RepID=UPI00263A2613|nr:TrbG/VirB9 family P-type conjugative transfer protein [Hydrogenophaga sp.]MCW5654240.1 TrbG/VirB9 family P-type conjugative transfer protein [Hydrogenophaga sp.]
MACGAQASEKLLRKPAKIAPPSVVSTGVESKPVRVDERIRMVAYDPDAVIRLLGAYGYTLAVEFGADERIVAVSLGDTAAWQAVTRENVLYLKPHEDKAETNMLVQTTRRAYTFNLLAFQPMGVDDGRLTYRVRFRYPQDEARQLEVQTQVATEAAVREARTTVGAGTGLSIGQTPQARRKSPTQWNFSYSFKGSRVAAPLQVLDDGEFTYLRFAHYESVPAVFEVDTQKKETLANFRREGEWLVIEKVTRQLVFRLSGNAEIACVFNDAYPERPESSLKER